MYWCEVNELYLISQQFEGIMSYLSNFHFYERPLVSLARTQMLRKHLGDKVVLKKIVVHIKFNIDIGTGMMEYECGGKQKVNLRYFEAANAQRTIMTPIRCCLALERQRRIIWHYCVISCRSVFVVFNHRVII